MRALFFTVCRFMWSVFPCSWLLLHQFVTYRATPAAATLCLELFAEVRMRLEAVGKRYGVRQPWVVRDVSLDVGGGRLIRVEGPNGSGKSTLLRVAAGVTVASRGRVTGRPHTGYVPERFPGGLPFSGQEYLLHMARVHGLRGDAGRQRVDEWLERLGAAGYAAAPLRALSKGMCQKVAIAQALLPQPGLLVLDEAWTGLDQAARAALDDAVAERVAAGGSVLYVDHDPARLTGRADEHWRLGGDGRVTVTAGQHVGNRDMANGGKPGGAIGDPALQHDAGGSVVTIELAGVGPGGLARLADMPGVLSSAAAPAAGHVLLRVAARQSDAVLRQVLAWDGVHVAGVRP
jgi:ABC-2 type transport system ATP-binding protein